MPLFMQIAAMKKTTSGSPASGFIQKNATEFDVEKEYQNVVSSRRPTNSAKSKSSQPGSSKSQTRQSSSSHFKSTAAMILGNK